MKTHLDLSEWAERALTVSACGYNRENIRCKMGSKQGVLQLAPQPAREASRHASATLSALSEA